MALENEVDQQRALISSLQRLRIEQPQWDDEQRRQLNDGRLSPLEDAAVRLLANLVEVDEGLNKAAQLLKRDRGR